MTEDAMQDDVKRKAENAADFLGACKDAGFTSEQFEGLFKTIVDLGESFCARSFADAARFFDVVAANVKAKGMDPTRFLRNRDEYASFENGSCFNPGSKLIWTAHDVELFKKAYMGATPGSDAEKFRLEMLGRALQELGQEENRLERSMRITNSFHDSVYGVPGREAASAQALLWLAQQGKTLVQRDAAPECLERAANHLASAALRCDPSDTPEKKDVLDALSHVLPLLQKKDAEAAKNFFAKHGPFAANDPELKKTMAVLMKSLDPLTEPVRGFDNLKNTLFGGFSRHR